MGQKDTKKVSSTAAWLAGKWDEKRLVALSSVGAAVFLTGFKLTVGLFTGSLGILSEALHSALDLTAALVTFIAVRISDKPADERHQFGHGKIENLSALVETVLLLITCGWIIYEAVQRLFFRSVEIEVSIWAFGVMAASIVVDISRSRALSRAAQKHKSQALEADALHFSTDVWSSSVVIAGLGFVWLGERLGIPWLSKADAVAALVVAMIVVYVSLQLGQRAVFVLLDAAPSGLAGQIETAIRELTGVQDVKLVRVRQAGPQVFVDVTISVAPGLSLQEGHAIATQVENIIGVLSPNADVIVHVDTSHIAPDELPARVRAIAAAHGMRVHGLHAHEIDGRVSLCLHAEVDSRLTLEDAHRQVDDFEQEIRQFLGRESEVTSHIEPVDSALLVGPARWLASEEATRATILDVAGEVFGPRSAHDVQLIHGTDGQCDLTMHCRLAGDTPITDAHALSDAAEKELRKRLPGISQIVIHVEPGKELAKSSS